MKNAFLIIPFLLVLFSCNRDTAARQLRYAESGKIAPYADTLVTKAFESLDRDLPFLIDSLYKIKAKKYTVIENYYTEIKGLLPKDTGLRIILRDTQWFERSLQKRFLPDTEKFLSDINVQELYGLYYPNHEYPYTAYTLTTSTLSGTVYLKNMLVMSKGINNCIRNVASRLHGHKKQAFYKYVAENYDYFSPEKKEIKSQSIRVRYITLTEGDLIYVGVDIYGTHFLISYNKRRNWALTEIKKLWTY